MVDWTEKQTLAIQTKDKNLLVSASAGSGKTAVLVERILRMVKSKYLQTDEILAITFTKAAAGELKQRIRKTLKEEILSSSGEDKEYFSLQSEKLDSANISTLHSFCFNIIKKYFHLLSIDPQVRIMRDEERSILSMEAIEEVFEEYYDKEDNFFLEFIDTFSTGGDDTMIKENIISSYESLRNIADYDICLKEFVEYFPGNEEEFSSSRAAKFILDEAGRIIKEARKKYSSALEICRVEEEDAKKPVTDNISSMIEVLDLLETKRNSSLKDFFDCVHEVSMPRAKTAKNINRKEEIEYFRNCGKDIYGDLKKYVPFDYETSLYHTTKMKPYMEKFSEILFSYENVLKRKKQDKKTVDYSDLEHLCLKVLQDDAASNEIRSSFKQILADEYQDINGVQEAIIRSLSSEDNLFMVGDVKQSIYRFRQADPGIFSEKYERFRMAGEDDKNKLIHLNNNFRSSDIIIDFVNMLFSAIMTKETCRIDFFPDEVMQASSTITIDEPVHMRLIDCRGYVGDDIENKRDAEAVYVANLIKNEILAKTYTVDGSPVIFREDQIAVIDRAMNAKAHYFLKAFEEVGLKADIRENSKYYDAFEVSLVINLLRLIDNEYNDIALLAVMRSFLYDFSEDMLTKIRVSAKECMYFHEAVRKYSGNGDDENILKRLSALFGDIKRYRAMSLHISIASLLEIILREKHITAFLSAMPDGDKRCDNMKELVNIADEFESSSSKGLYDFILYADKCREKMNTKSPSVSKGGVKLMTTHSSKGLEFDVVIITGCATQIRSSDQSFNILIDKDFGLCPKFTDTAVGYKANTMEFTAHARNQSLQNKAEEMRILYVATTRAKKILYMTAALDKQEDISRIYTENLGSYELMKMSDYYSWIKYAYDTFTGNKDKIMDIHVHYPYSEENKPERTAKKKDVFEEMPEEKEMAEIIRMNYEYIYPHHSFNIPTKISVSALKEENQTIGADKLIARIPIRESYEDRKDSKAAAQKGTLIHKILENMDIKNIGNSGVGAEIMRVAGQSKEDLSSLGEKDLRMIADFFATDLGQMMINSSDLHREQPFILRQKASYVSENWKDSSDEILIQGIIDCWFEYNGRIYLADFKTDRIKSPAHMDELTEKYSIQLGYYKKALEESLGRDVEGAYICYLRENKIVEV